MKHQLIFLTIAAGTVAASSAVAGQNQAAQSTTQTMSLESHYPEYRAGADETPTKTRKQVRAETDAARRLGLLEFNDHELPTATPEQACIIAEGGRQALAEEQRAALRTAQRPRN